jgi:DNA-binding NarL/FixJ family response regulator
MDHSGANGSMPKIGVLIVDDISDTRENLSKLLMFERDIEVVGTAGSGPEALEVARKLYPDVVLMDINMPEMDGIKAAELMSSDMPGIGIIMMSVQGEQDYLRRAMLAGAREFLVKPFSWPRRRCRCRAQVCPAPSRTKRTAIKAEYSRSSAPRAA